MKKIKQKIAELSEVLKKRNHPTHRYYDNLLSLIDTHPKEIMDEIINSYSITDYANFNLEERNLLNELLNEIQNIKKQ
jgi:hypothetical protein